MFIAKKGINVEYVNIYESLRL